MNYSIIATSMESSLNIQNYSINNFLPSAVVSSQSNTGQVRGIPLINFDPDHREYSLSQEAIDLLRSLRGECRVISVSGKPMVGKSSLLNLLISFLLGMDTSQEDISYKYIYPVGDRTTSTTQGIEMYWLLIKGKNFIFLDVEGDGDPRRGDAGVWISTTLLQIAVGMSHVHFHNYIGLPQDNFLNDFELISRVLRQNRVHPEFQIKYSVLIRDHDFISREISPEQLERYKAPINEKFGTNRIDYSLHLLPRPPKHIRQKNSDESSCIALTSTGILCKKCQDHRFISILRGITNELYQHLNQAVPFKSGNDLVRALQQLEDINRRERPFYSNRGPMGQQRLDLLLREGARIQAGLAGVEQYQAENGLYRQAQGLMSDHPNIADEELSQKFNRTGSYLESKISQMTYLIPELSRFLDRYLLDNNALIINKEEKNACWEAYIAPFGGVTKDILDSLREYGGMIEEICQTLLEIKTRVTDHLKEYMKVALEVQNKKLAISANFLTTSVLGLIGREVAAKTAAVVFGIGGVIGVAITVYCLVQASRELKAKRNTEDELNPGRIDGIRNAMDAKAEMEKIEEFVTKLVDDFERSRKTLREILSEKTSENFILIAEILDAMNDKINGKNVSLENQDRLLQRLNAVETNLQRFKQCL